MTLSSDSVYAEGRGVRGSGPRQALRPPRRTPSLARVQVSHQHTKLLRIPSFLPNLEESPLPCLPPGAKSGSLDSELSMSPKRNSISRTYKDKGPFHILSSTSQTSKVPEGPSQAPATTLTSSSTRLFGLAKPKDKKEKKKKNKGGRSQPGGESHTVSPVAALSLLSGEVGGC